MSKITESARGEECTIRIPGVCNYDPATTVWAHSNRGSDGKGMGLKSKDENGAYACWACHATYDRQKKRPANISLEQVEEMFSIAMRVSRLILARKGLVKNTHFLGEFPSEKNTPSTDF